MTPMADTPEDQLKTTHDALARAEVERDAATLGRLIAHDFEGVDPAGEAMDRAEVLAAYLSGGVVLHKVRWDELNVRVFGQAGLVTGRSRIEGITPAGTFQGRFRFTDVYVLREGEWRLVASHTSPLPGR